MQMVLPPSLVLARVGEAGSEIPVAIERGHAWDLRAIAADIDRRFWEAGGFAAAMEASAGGGLPEMEIGGLRIGAPVARPGKIVCVGRNFADHAAETGAAVLPEPVVFMKAPYTCSGPFDPVAPIRGSKTFDYEVELAAVISETASYLADPDDGLAHVGGYCVANDLSDREMQFDRGGSQWTKGKNFPRSCPLGPWLTPAGALGAPEEVQLRLEVNGELRQSAAVSEMVFDVGFLVHYLSQCMTLEPGDVVLCGTPSGVAYGMAEPKGYLRPGDIVEASITGLGTQRLAVVEP